MSSRQILAWGALTLLAACGQGGRLPASSGQLCEVMVADSAGVLTHILEQSYPGLPQTEPSYDVRRLPAGEPQGVYRYARTIIIYSHGCPLRIERNRYASQQMVVYTDGSDPSRLLAALQRADLTREVTRIRQRHNAQAERRALDRMGIRISLPDYMQVSADSAGWLWLAAQTDRVVRSVCMYEVADTARLVQHTNEVLRTHIKGETDDMYMQAIPATLRQSTLADGSLWLQGLWQMQHDAMGGPMVMRVMPRGGRWVAVVAFVYAPSIKKRNLMVEMKSILYTIK